MMKRLRRNVPRNARGPERKRKRTKGAKTRSACCLPDELLMAIFALVADDPRTLCSIERACKSFRWTAGEPSLWMRAYRSHWGPTERRMSRESERAASEGGWKAGFVRTWSEWSVARRKRPRGARISARMAERTRWLVSHGLLGRLSTEVVPALPRNAWVRDSAPYSSRKTGAEGGIGWWDQFWWRMCKRAFATRDHEAARLLCSDSGCDGSEPVPWCGCVSGYPRRYRKLMRESIARDSPECVAVLLARFPGILRFFV